MSTELGVTIIVVLLGMGALLAARAGIHSMQSARKVAFFRTRRAHVLAGWQWLILAFILFSFSTASALFGEPVANRLFPPPTVTPLPSQTPTTTPPPTATLTPSVTNTDTATVTYTPEGTLTPTPTLTQTASQTPSQTPTGTATATSSSTSIPTNTFTATASRTLIPTSTSISTRTPRPTWTPSPTRTPRPTLTFTLTSTPTLTLTASFTPTFTLTSTITQTPTPTRTPLPTSTVRPTDTPRPTSTRQPTNTSTLTSTITNTPSQTLTSTLTFTVTSSQTLTQTPSITATFTSTSTIAETSTHAFTPLPTATVRPTNTTEPPFTREPTATSTSTATRTSTSPPTFTPSFTVTSSRTTTPIPSRTSTRTPTPNTGCDRIELVTHLTVPDNSVLAPGSSFTKIWRLRNVGTCTWKTTYRVVFVSGDVMGGQSFLPLPKEVAPGETIDLAMNFKAPRIQGSYRGNWQIRNQRGEVFGITSTANRPFWVMIRVRAPALIGTSYDFVANACSARWFSGAGNLKCPGINDDKNGFVLQQDTARLEDGKLVMRPSLLTSPQNISNGYIRGIYPSYKVQDGDRFRAIINCEDQATSCSVLFRLDYLNNGLVQNFWSLDQHYDRSYYTVDLDLSPLVGQDVRFVLTVLSQGPASGDRALWVEPRIVRGDVSPSTPTP